MGVVGEAEKRANGPKKDEGTCRSKLIRMGMMDKWMEAKAQLGVGVKLAINFSLCAYWESRCPMMFREQRTHRGVIMQIRAKNNHNH
jgi:hypothetical protein